MRTSRFHTLLPLALIVAGCSSGRMTADTEVMLQPGASAVLTATGDEATIRLTRTGDAAPSADTSVLVLTGPADDSGATGLSKTSTAVPLPVGATIVHEQREPAFRIVVVNNGDKAANVKIHITGADGVSIVQPAPNRGTNK